MNSRDGFPQTGADEVRISPSSGAADRAAQAYEKAFLESAHSNESKLRLLEERMKRPQSTAQMSDAVRAGAPEPHSDDDDDDDEARLRGALLTPRKSSDADLARPPRPPWAETPSPRPPRLPTVLSAVSRASKTISARATGPASPPRRRPSSPPPRTAPEPSGKKTIPRKRRSRRRGERPRPARQREPRRSRVGRRAGASARGGEARGGRIEAKGIEARVGSASASSPAPTPSPPSSPPRENATPPLSPRVRRKRRAGWKVSKRSR